MIGKTPDRIWLIDEGSEIIWHDDPDPSGYVDESDTEEYIKAASLSNSALTPGYKPADSVTLNMNDLTGDSLIKIYDIVKEDSEGEENIEAAKHINNSILYSKRRICKIK